MNSEQSTNAQAVQPATRRVINGGAVGQLLARNRRLAVLGPDRAFVVLREETAPRTTHLRTTPPAA